MASSTISCYSYYITFIIFSCIYVCHCHLIYVYMLFSHEFMSMYLLHLKMSGLFIFYWFYLLAVGRNTTVNQTDNLCFSHSSAHSTSHWKNKRKKKVCGSDCIVTIKWIILIQLVFILLLLLSIGNQKLLIFFYFASKNQIQYLYK